MSEEILNVKSWHTAYIALGTNLGDKEKNLQCALELLQRHGIKIERVSAFITTEPYGVTDQPPFLNGVCSVRTLQTPLELLHTLLAVEREMGRVRLRHWGERNIDLDLLLYEDAVLDTEELRLPHPDMQNREFVLLPFAEIAPDVRHPLLHKNMRQLCDELVTMKLKEAEPMEIDTQKLLQRFIAYAQINTTSDDQSQTFPSAARELDLAHYLVDERTRVGLSDVEMTEYGYVLATLPASCASELPVIGLIAHMDTSCEASGENVQVMLHKNYDGGRLVLNDRNVLDPADFPELLSYVGQDILTSDGTTLLGADDKAGITAIVTACEYLLTHPEIKHGRIRLAFTPDEEVGRGTEHFPMAQFGADFAYTVDGGALGELSYETFNACNAHVVFHGVSVHPGNAKNKMRNAVTMAAEWQTNLPAGERPEYTDGYEGFYHTLRINGGTDKVEIDMILRDHDRKILEQRKRYLLALASMLEAKYGTGTVECSLKDCYSNMKEYIMPVYEIVARAENAMRAAGVQPQILPVRGGTDGSQLSAMGLPCPNLFTGGHNFHGRFEYLPVRSLQKITEVLVQLVRL